MYKEIVDTQKDGENRGLILLTVVEKAYVRNLTDRVGSLLI